MTLVVAALMPLILLSILIWMTGQFWGRKGGPMSFAGAVLKRLGRYVARGFRALSRQFYRWGREMRQAARTQPWYIRLTVGTLALVPSTTGFVLSIPAGILAGGGRGNGQRQRH